MLATLVNILSLDSNRIGLKSILRAGFEGWTDIEPIWTSFDPELSKNKLRVLGWSKNRKKNV